MSWIEKLYKTYDNCISEVGKEIVDSEGNLLYQLMPIAHTSQNAQIEIVLNMKGDFKRASVVPKNGSQQTILPATEKAAGRSGSLIAPLSLGDKLQYVAGDYVDFGGEKKPGYKNYLERLERWSASKYALPELKAVFSYCKKQSVIADLVKHNILYHDKETNAFPVKWEREQEIKPEIFNALQGEQLDALVRFQVEEAGKHDSKLWKNKALWDSWILYYTSNKILEDNADIEKEKDKMPIDKKVFCYVSGSTQNYAGNHPSKIRHSGDGGKLISSNDTSNFTYRGRFILSEEACTIGYDVSQKAHNALRWLISRQGYRDGDLAVVAWTTKGQETPILISDSFKLYYDDEDIIEDGISVDTAQGAAEALNKKIRGYSAFIGETDYVVIMGLNSIIPGRISVSFYRELTGSDYLKRIEHWHDTCTWLQRYSKEKIFVGAPSPIDIAKAAYGDEVDEKLRRATVSRLLPCIVDNANIPYDIVVSTVRMACKKNSKDWWEWEKTLGIACALYRYYKLHKKKEVYTLALNRDLRNRDYLYGRLLAVADGLESYSLQKVNQERPTNAARLMQRFADRPFTTWRTIELNLQPYIQRLGKDSIYNTELDEILGMVFEQEQFNQDNSLSGEFLLGYHSERAWIKEWIYSHSKKKENKEKE